MRERRNVIVTGGTGALGQSVVEAFLAEGDRVCAPWIVEAESQRMQQRFGAALSEGRLVLLRADVSEEKGASEVAASAAAEPSGASAAKPGSSGIAVLVNGVGGFAAGPLAETSLEVWDRLYRSNVRAAAAMSRAVLGGMVARGRGAIVNVAAHAALDPPGGMAAYVASKAALVALTRSLAREVPRGVRVNAVLPTTIDTPANRAAMPDADVSQWTKPEQIAAVIRWLASDAAEAVRGALVPV
jgi:NAD(P)-dependent dehydrogenase (short-subunit alcohol dehydrogenase family)